MDVRQWQQIEEITLKAMELPEAERSGFVDEMCTGDKILLSEVASLLKHIDEEESFLDPEELEKIVGSFVQHGESKLLGKKLGIYRIVREIGAGGMGAVFLAERDDGEFDQQVAVKIVRQTIIENELANHFRRERQILASLNHPNIAKLLDGGVTDEGAPFLVMELIEGDPLVEFAEKHSLSETARLHLFVKICSAVAYAHRNLIVHRDIKPSNILVSNDGEPKLLDFGLAKIVDVGTPGDQIRTAFLAHTPGYASPEQMRGENVATASDIYSLGKVLSELIQTSRSESGPPNADLKNIIAMSLRDEPERRYRSVEAFAGDIERYLKGLPLTARPSTFKYRAGKFVKRHSIAVAAAFLVLASLIGGIAVSVWQAREARQEKTKAERINAFLEQMLDYANPILNLPRNNSRQSTMTDVLDATAKRLDEGEFADQPEIRAELERILGGNYTNQGKGDLATNHFKKYVDLQFQLYGEDDVRLLMAREIKAWLLFEQGKLTESETIFRQILPLMRTEQQKGEFKPENLIDSVSTFASLRRTQGDSMEAEDLFRESLRLSEQVPVQSRYILIGVTRSTLASTLGDQGNFDEALQTSRDAVEEYRRRAQTDTPDYGFSLTVLGGFLAEKGDFAEADAILLEAEAIFRKLLSPSHLWLGDNLRNQAISLYGQGRYSDALDKVNETLRIYLAEFGPHYDNYPTALITKGLILSKTGELKEGEKILREAVRLRTDSLFPDHYWIALAKGALGESLMIQKHFDEAESLLADSYASLVRSQGETNPRTALARSRLDELYKNRP